VGGAASLFHGGSLAPLAAPQPAEALWFKGICDGILAKVQKWYRDYDRGEVFATRDWRHQVGGTVKVPVVRLHSIPFTRVEVDRLLGIVQALSENLALKTNAALMEVSWRKSRPVAAGPPGHRWMKLAFRKSEIKSLIDALIMAKTGQAAPASLDAELLEAYKKSVK